MPYFMINIKIIMGMYFILGRKYKTLTASVLTVNVAELTAYNYSIHLTPIPLRSIGASDAGVIGGKWESNRIIKINIKQPFDALNLDNKQPSPH